MSDLFSQLRPAVQELYPEVYLLANFVETASLIRTINNIVALAPYRKMMTPMGHYTGVALTNCGDYGWVSDLSGYRYSQHDPQTNAPWPKMPSVLSELATNAAAKVGFNGFVSDACLINHYPIGSSLGAHQDKNETDFSKPIVSVSIGLSATFQIFGKQRSGKPVNCRLMDGDVMVWGGNSRLIYHGVRTIKADSQQPQLQKRINITFRKAN